MRRVLFPIVLGLLGFGLLLTSVALAAPNQSRPPVVEISAPPGALITDTNGITPTTGFSHPVASAIAEFFGVDYGEILSLHQQGLGFGVIAKAYFVAETLGITPTGVISEFQSGTGWGVILKGYGLHPGLAGRGGNLGQIMSNRDGKELPPGQLKKAQPGDGADFTPPGQLKKGDERSDPQRGGPPDTPPGQARGKGKK